MQDDNASATLPNDVQVPSSKVHARRDKQYIRPELVDHGMQRVVRHPDCIFGGQVLGVKVQSAI
jgi:hypothetical protein